MQDTDDNSSPPSKISKKTTSAGNKSPDKGRKSAAGALTSDMPGASTSDMSGTSTSVASNLATLGASTSAASGASTSASSEVSTSASSEISTSTELGTSTLVVPVETSAVVHGCYHQNNNNDNDGDCSNNDEDDDNISVHNLQNRKKKLSSLRSVSVQDGGGDVGKTVLLPDRKLLLEAEIEALDNVPISTRITEVKLPAGKPLKNVNNSPTSDNKNEKGKII